MKLVMKTARIFSSRTILISSHDYSHREYRELKKSIRTMNRRSDVEKISLIEEGKRIGVNEVIKCKYIINNSSKP